MEKCKLTYIWKVWHFGFGVVSLFQRNTVVRFETGVFGYVHTAGLILLYFFLEFLLPEMFLLFYFIVSAPSP